MSQNPEELTKKIIAYYAAWKAFKAAEKRATDLVAQATQQMGTLNDWKQMSNTRQRFDSSKWPLGKDLEAALNDFRQKSQALERCWNDLPEEERGCFQSPP